MTCLRADVPADEFDVIVDGDFVLMSKDEWERVREALRRARANRLIPLGPWRWPTPPDTRWGPYEVSSGEGS